MKRTLKTLLTAVLILTLVLSGSLTAFAADNNAIKVQYNGKSLDFSGAVKNVDGRIVVPFRLILQAMGAEVSYDTASKTVSAITPHNEFSFVVGKKDITIKENGVTVTKTMDVVPFIDKAESATYVPVRFIGESMGYSVSWDAASKTVIIIDPETVFGTADEDFSVLKKLLSSDLDMEKAYQTTGDFDMNIAVADGGAGIPMNVSAKGSMSGVQQRMDADMLVKYAFNFDQMFSNLSAEEKAMTEEILKAYKNTEMKLKLNGETGETYMQSNLFSVMNPAAGENTWYKMNVYDTYDQMGIDLKAMSELGYGEMDLSKVLASYLKVLPGADTDTYQEMKMSYAFLKNLVGDDAFKKQTSGSTNTYTVKVDKAAIIAAAAKTALAEGITKEYVNELIENELSGGTFTANIVIKDTAGKLSSYECSGTVNADGLKGSFSMAGNQKTAKAKLSFDMGKLMKMDISYQTKVSETAQKPNIALPENADVVEFPPTMVP
ncbi:copper amine oxidase N-terminal domain-containing protein [Anoxybacterium hadale]|uniref:Copper amine oxidase N-terminal domain-containing protein n=1 Tax=Anoxybacterium hadale TaxID=3408580 RepID=A0ACD1AEB5_9FIRM|nr:copper amine oxidase N-terminal domain-containing protein [Clostridiales bacterium]